MAHEKIDKDVLLDNSLNYGRNIGTWAPGELDKMIRGGKCVLLSLEDYRKWSRKLPPEFIKDVISFCCGKALFSEFSELHRLSIFCVKT